MAAKIETPICSPLLQPMYRPSALLARLGISIVKSRLNSRDVRRVTFPIDTAQRM
jgi:hypothetical protein